MMKKTLLILLALTMVFSAFAATVSAYAESAEGAPAYEIEYSSSEIVSGVGLDSSGSTAKDYDETENAMKIYASKDGKAPARFLVKYGSNIKADEYPVLAIVVKANGIIKPATSTRTTGTEFLNNPDETDAKGTLGEGTSNVSTWGLENKTYELAELGDGYQLMMVDFWQASEVYGKYNGEVYQLVSDKKAVSTYVDLLPYSDGSWTYNETDYFFVRSAALFTDKETAKEYYGADVIDYHMISLDSETAYNQNIGNSTVANSSASSIEYDSSVGAMYVTPNTTKNESATVSLTVKSMDIDPASYPYVAIKVKLKDSSSVFGQLAGYTGASQTYKNRCSGSTYNLTASTSYSATTDWQIITVNANDIPLQVSSKSPLVNFPLTSHTFWNKINLQLCPYNQTDIESEGYWIEWIGFFKNEEDISLYENRDNSAKWYGWQKGDVKTVDNVDVYKARLLLTVDSNYENYEKAGAVITAVCESGTYDLSMDTGVVFDSVLAMSDGGSLSAVDAPTGRKFVALVIDGIPVSEGEITLTVEPYIEKNGSRFFGETYTLVVSSTAE